MIALTLSEVAAATGGRLTGGAAPESTVTGPVVADSRAVVPGALFVALPGERSDGHDFAAAAVAAGAVGVLAGREVAAPAVVVDDPLAALGRLARTVVDRLSGPDGLSGRDGLSGPDGAAGLTVIGVTGSSGKTSTKDLLAAVLAAAGPTVAPVGSFNNELGLPLTALRCDHGTRFLVAEMGARGPGDLRRLCAITPPQIAVVLNVGSAHAGVFGSPQATAAAKSELPAALTEGGVAVLNADDPAVRAMRPGAGARVVLFGRADDAQVRAQDVRLDGQARAGFRLVTAAGQARVQLRLHGEHQVSNALAAAAVALETGMSVPRVADLLSAADQGSRWRMEVTTRADGVQLVNDAYNANPDSVRAALAALAVMGRDGPAGPRRTWAVLGEMLELGSQSPAEHEAIGRVAARLGVSHLIAVGPGAPELIRQGALLEGEPGRSGEPGGQGEPGRADADRDAVWVPDLEAALDVLETRLRPGDVVLVKASRSVGFDVLAERLLAGDVARVGRRSAGPRGGEGIA